MFDATRGNQALADQVEERSDEFASRFDQLPPRQQLTILQRMNLLLDSPDDVAAFTSGTYAQDSSGNPARALGSGTNGGPSNAKEGLQAIMDDSSVNDGIKAALRRILVPSDPEYIEVENDGTPKELTAAKRERDAAVRERDAAQRELTTERDDSKPSSLAGKLKATTKERDDARSATGGLTDEQKAKIKKGREAFEGRKDAAIGGGVKLTGNQTDDIDKMFAALPTS